MNKKQNNFPWNHHRRFNAAANAIKQEFGGRVQKLTLDAGFTCPNRDGTKSTGGCAFCNNNAFNPPYCMPEKSVSQQIAEGIKFHEKRYRTAGQYLAYFQAYSNTYATVEHLRKLYYEALEHEKVIGLIIGTRPDCINEPIFELLGEINKDYYLVVEFGIESVYDETLEYINRGHTFKESKTAIEQCGKHGITCGGHYIFGLPGETREMMMDSAKTLSELPLHSIKFHQLQYVKGTKIGDDYINDPNSFNQFTLEEYIDFIVEYLERFTPEIIIERLAGEAQPHLNVGEQWGLRYDQILNLIEKKMEELDTWQGKHYVN